MPYPTPQEVARDEVPERVSTLRVEAAPPMTRDEAIAALMAAEGYTNLIQFLELCVVDSVCPAICMACGHVGEPMEPDQDAGHCEACGESKVTSALVIEGLI